MFSLSFLRHRFMHYDVSLTLDVIDTFIAQTETSIAENIRQFQIQGPETTEIDISPEDNIYQTIDHYMGLDSASVDLDEMFTSYYPSVTRRSAFLTLYGMLEHDYEKLCNGFTRIHNVSIKLSDLTGSGFERCDLYARKIIGMQTSDHYSSVKKVTKLRNACAHNDARFITNGGQQIAELEVLMRMHSEVLGHDREQVNFKAGSLQAMTSILKNYFNDVEKALKAHQTPDSFKEFSK